MIRPFTLIKENKKLKEDVARLNKQKISTFSETTQLLKSIRWLKEKLREFRWISCIWGKCGTPKFYRTKVYAWETRVESVRKLMSKHKWLDINLMLLAYYRQIESYPCLDKSVYSFWWDVQKWVIPAPSNIRRIIQRELSKNKKK